MTIHSNPVTAAKKTLDDIQLQMEQRANAVRSAFQSIRDLETQLDEARARADETLQPDDIKQASALFSRLESTKATWPFSGLTEQEAIGAEISKITNAPSTFEALHVVASERARKLNALASRKWGECAKAFERFIAAGNDPGDVIEIDFCYGSKHSDSPLFSDAYRALKAARHLQQEAGHARTFAEGLLQVSRGMNRSDIAQYDFKGLVRLATKPLPE